jgi:hypothetical protein
MPKLLLPVFFIIAFATVLVAQPNAKTASVITSGNQKTHTQFRVGAEDARAFAAWAHRNFPGSAIRQHASKKNFTVEGISLAALQQSPWVKYIDRPNRKAQPETVLGDFDFTINKITALRSHFTNFSGRNFTLSIKEKPFDSLDLDINGRTKPSIQFDEPTTPHATFMASIAVGAGNTTPYAWGPAWGAFVTTSDFDELLPDASADLNALGVTVQNHSYGLGFIENYYGIESNAYDGFCVENPKILHVFSSGNSGLLTPTEGTYAGVTAYANLTGQFKTSKNSLSVGSSDRLGNLVSLSSRGPAHDGRVKPELIAFGDAGSSDAAAVVSGISLVLQDIYKNKFGELPDAALLKAVLINSADDAGRPHVDFETGYGNADALGAARTLQEERFYTGEVTQGQTVTVPITIPANAQQVKVTLVWHDMPAEVFAEYALVNDLDLSLENSSTAETWKPWILNTDPSVTQLQQPAARGVDRVNNVEQISIDGPAAGDYEIAVNGFSVQGTQRFYVAYEFLTGFEWTYPLATDAIPANTQTVIHWNWGNVSESGALAYRFAGEDIWHAIAESVDLNSTNFIWAVPDTSARVQLRFTTASEEFLSATFPISKPNQLKVGYNCETELLLVWDKIPGAASYRLYTIAEKYLEVYQTTTDTFAVIPKSESLSNFYALAPVFSGQPGFRAPTINYNFQGTDCYLISFFAQQYLVEEEARFSAKLGATYKLQSVTLERSSDHVFEPVFVTEVISGNEFELSDPSPPPGPVRYRLKLSSLVEPSIVSEETEIFVVRKNDLFVFPNPARRGDWINVVVNDEEFAAAEFYDTQGRFVDTALDNGPVKAFDTSRLQPGAFIVRIRKANGQWLMGKVIIL